MIILFHGYVNSPHENLHVTEITSIASFTLWLKNIDMLKAITKDKYYSI